MVSTEKNLVEGRRGDITTHEELKLGLRREVEVHTEVAVDAVVGHLGEGVGGKLVLYTNVLREPN